MSIILHKRPAWLDELEGAVGSVQKSMLVRSQLDDAKQNRKLKQKQEERAQNLADLNAGLVTAQTQGISASTKRAEEDQAFQRAAQPLKMQAAQEELNQQSLQGEAKAYQFDRQKQEDQAGEQFWSEISQAPPDQIGTVASKYLAKLPPKLQAFALDEIHRVKKQQLYDQSFMQTDERIARAVQDGVLPDDGGEIRQSLAEWHGIATSGEPGMELQARLHPGNPDKIIQALTALRAKRDTELTHAARNQEVAQDLERQYQEYQLQMQSSGQINDPEVQQKLTQMKAAVVSIAGAPSATDGERIGVINHFAALKSPPKAIPVPQGIDWFHADDRSKAQLELAATESLHKNGVNDPSPSQVDKQMQLLARVNQWTNVGKQLPPELEKARKQPVTTPAEVAPRAVTAPSGLAPAKRRYVFKQLAEALKGDKDPEQKKLDIEALLSFYGIDWSKATEKDRAELDALGK